MKLAVIHLVDSRDKAKALDYIQRNESNGFMNFYALCGDPRFEFPKEFIKPKHTIINTSTFISDWVKDAILYLDWCGEDYDFVQIRDWDDTYDLDRVINKEFESNIGMVCFNYKVRYQPNVSIEGTNPYGTFKSETLIGLPEVELGPYIIHRQFKFLSKKLVSLVSSVLKSSEYPKVGVLDETLLLPICLIECYRNNLAIKSGIDSDMIFEISKSSDTHKDALSIKYARYLDTYAKTYNFISNYYGEVIKHDLDLSTFIYKCLRDRSSKTLFSIGFHKVNG